MLEVRLIKYFNYVVASEVVSQDLVEWNSLHLFFPICATLDYRYAALTTKLVNFSTNLDILFSSSIENNGVKSLPFDIIQSWKY